VAEITKTTPPLAEARHLCKERIGKVVSDKMQKTIVVQVQRTYRHPIYQKVMRGNKKYYAHDEKETANVGDVVRIVETRPLSKTKRWRLAEVLQKGKAPVENLEVKS